MADTPTPERLFKIELVVAGDTTYCVPLKTALDQWAERAGQRVLGSWVVPASKLEGDRSCHACGARRPSDAPQDALRLRVTWDKVPGSSAWDATRHALGHLERGCPDIPGAAVQLAVATEVQDPSALAPRGL